MPRRNDIKKVMVIGSGPIVIGQAAEFDYAGTQACLALKEEGYQVILVNSNPATPHQTSICLSLLSRKIFSWFILNHYNTQLAFP